MSLSNSPFHEVHRLKNWHIVLSLNYNYLALCSFVKLYAYLGNIIWIFFSKFVFQAFLFLLIKVVYSWYFYYDDKVIVNIFSNNLYWLFSILKWWPHTISNQLYCNYMFVTNLERCWNFWEYWNIRKNFSLGTIAFDAQCLPHFVRYILKHLIYILKDQSLQSKWVT